MKFKFTIGRRIGLGFGLLILLMLLVFYSTNQTLNKARSINKETNEIYAPSVDALEKLKILIIRSRMLITNWGLVQSRNDDIGKRQLRHLTNREWPELQQRLENLSKKWSDNKGKGYDRTKAEHLQEIFEDIEKLFGVHETIKSQLNSFESYNEPQIRYLIRPMVENEGEVHIQTKRILYSLDQLIKRQEKTSMQARDTMIQSFDTLQFMVQYLGSFLMLGGVLIAIFTVRSIVKPVQKLKRILLDLGKGIFPEFKMKPTNDEIGEMVLALNALVDGLQRTTEFSKQVGSGNFDFDHKPLSEQDTLGHALLKMRDELAENERVLEQKVAQRTEEVVEQKEEVERQRQKVEGLYKDLTDSIRYAQRLQNSILPSEDWISERLSDFFILFKPKDIVSGDFYWFEETDGKLVYSAVDCTGHGVPGAFMSLVGHNGLDQAVNEHKLQKPSDILDDLNKLTSESLNKTSEGASVKDGMDLALCTLDLKNNKLEYAGANNPLYFIRDGEFTQIKGDKVPIGGDQEGEHQYTNHELDIRSGDVIYIFSDGYPDQFGGPKGKKFKYKPFKELLLAEHHRPMSEQQKLLDQTIEEWRGELEQIDDILVIGVRIP